LQHRYGARHFEITDEALAPKVLLRLGDALRAHPEVEARFVGYARLEAGFTPDVCGRLHEMGVRKLFFGLESGSQVTLDHMDKGIRLADASTVLRNCADAGIAFHIFSIVGFPEETEERARDTLQFFLDNAATIDHPRNSFDIHPFGLDLRTDYADNAAAFGLMMDADDLAGRDFPLGPARWGNTRGLSESDVERLLVEFHGELLRAFPTYRQYQGHLWPGFEEYALLYADYYERRPFPFRFTLPPSGDPTTFRLLWAPSVRIEPGEGGYHVRCLGGETLVSEAALMLLAQPAAAMTTDELLTALTSRLSHAAEERRGRSVELRSIIDELLQVGALQLQPEPATVAAVD
jgi:hypothetical protein